MSHQPAMCTIIAKNYLAFARTLCRSFLAAHPDGRCYVLVIDEISGFFDPGAEPFEVVSLPDLAIPDTTALCFKYNITELSTAVKPFFMEYLFREKGLDKLLYLDPDILVTHRLNPLYEKLENCDMVLTPHLDQDFPEDGLEPDDSHILTSGIFNLGFLGLNASDNAGAFLSWWKVKLKDKCVIDHARGYFVDQRFVDLAFAMFPNIGIERAAGYNVAYWNLHSRKLGRDGDTWTCNGGPLYFFHFSSYHPEKPDQVSSHMNRYRLPDRPDLQPLFNLYKEQLMANGYSQARRWPYSFANFPDGEKITNAVRALYRNTPGQWDSPENPFTSKMLLRAARKARAIATARRHLRPVRRAAERVAGRKPPGSPSTGSSTR